MTQVTTNTVAAAGQTVSVPRPDSGAQAAIASSAGGVLELGFDPGAATASRVDNSLVFEVDGGGTVTLTDFFAVGDQTLPSLQLPDGTIVASADFFADSDLDISTAAGPAAAGPPPGSGTSYADDTGSLMGGLDKFGMLGTDYWTRGTEVAELGAGPAVFTPVADEPFIPFITIVPGAPGVPGSPEYVIGANGVTVTFNEAHLPNGSDPNPDGLSATIAFTITSNDGVASLTIASTSYAVVGGAVQGFPAGITDKTGNVLSNPRVTDLGNGQYLLEFDYSFENRFDHEAGQGRNLAESVDSFAISVGSVNGAQSGDVYLNVNVIDDIPEFTAIEQNEIGDRFVYGGKVEGGEVSGTVSLTEGADGANWDSLTLDGVPIVWADELSGTIPFTSGDKTIEVTVTKVEVGFTYSYTIPADAKEGDVYRLNFRIEDTDGDPTTISVTAEAPAVDTPEIKVTVIDGNIVVDEQYLRTSSGNPEKGGSAPDDQKPDKVTDSMSFAIVTEGNLDQITLMVGEQRVTLDPNDLDNPVWADADAAPSDPGYFTFNISGTGKENDPYVLTVTYTLLDNTLEHSADIGRDPLLADTVTVTSVVVNADGHTFSAPGDELANVSGTVTIIDDVPTFSFIAQDISDRSVVDGVVVGGLVTGSVKLVEGADGANWAGFRLSLDGTGKDATVVGVWTGEDDEVRTKPQTGDTAKVIINDVEVSLTMGENGVISYSYTIPAGSTADVTHTLGFYIKDQDDDKTSVKVPAEAPAVDTPEIKVTVIDGNIKLDEANLIGRGTAKNEDESKLSDSMSFAIVSEGNLSQIILTVNGQPVTLDPNDLDNPDWADAAPSASGNYTFSINGTGTADDPYVLTVTYTLTNNTTEHTQQGPDELLAYTVIVTSVVVSAGDLTFSATDDELANVSGTVTIIDDIPVENITADGHQGDGIFTGKLGEFGADGPAAKNAVRFGKFDDDGNIVFTDEMFDALNDQWTVNNGDQVTFGFDPDSNGTVLVGRDSTGEPVCRLEVKVDGNEAKWELTQYAPLDSKIVDWSNVKSMEVGASTAFTGGTPTTFVVTGTKNADGQLIAGDRANADIANGLRTKAEVAEFMENNPNVIFTYSVSSETLNGHSSSLGAGQTGSAGVVNSNMTVTIGVNSGLGLAGVVGPMAEPHTVTFGFTNNNGTPREINDSDATITVTFAPLGSTKKEDYVEVTLTSEEFAAIQNGTQATVTAPPGQHIVWIDVKSNTGNWGLSTLVESSAGISDPREVLVDQPVLNIPFVLTDGDGDKVPGELKVNPVIDPEQTVNGIVPTAADINGEEIDLATVATAMALVDPNENSEENGVSVETTFTIAPLGGNLGDILASSEQCDIGVAGRASDFDTYSWNGTGLEGGKTTIPHFHLGEDHLRFDDLLGQDEALTVETLVDLLKDGVLSLQLQENGVLVFEVHDRTEEHKLLQTVEIQVEGGVNDVAADFNTNLTAQAELLQQMIYSNTNTA